MTKGWNKIDNNIFQAYNMLLSFAGSFILYEPHRDCMSELIEMDLFKKMPVESDNPRFILASSYLHSIDSKHPFDYDELNRDYLELFGGKGKALAPPYGSVYLSKDSIINDRQTIEVRKIYNAYGWKSNSEGKVPDDHLGVELQFLNLLLEKYPELEDDICRKEITQDIKKFISVYLKPWIDDWNKLVQENAITDFYKGIAYLIMASVEDVLSLLSDTDTLLN